VLRLAKSLSETAQRKLKSPNDTMFAEAPETVKGTGQANAGGARGLEYSLGIRGGDKTLNTRRIQLWRCCYCDMWQIQMHIQWRRHKNVHQLLTISHSNCPKYNLRCSLISTNSLATSFADTSCIRRLCITLFWCKWNYELSCKKWHFSAPVRPRTTRAAGPRCPRGSGAPECTA